MVDGRVKASLSFAFHVCMYCLFVLDWCTTSLHYEGGEGKGLRNENEAVREIVALKCTWLAFRVGNSGNRSRNFSLF